LGEIVLVLVVVLVLEGVGQRTDDGVTWASRETRAEERDGVRKIKVTFANFWKNRTYLEDEDDNEYENDKRV